VHEVKSAEDWVVAGVKIDFLGVKKQLLATLGEHRRIQTLTKMLMVKRCFFPDGLVNRSVAPTVSCLAGY